MLSFGKVFLVISLVVKVVIGQVPGPNPRDASAYAARMNEMRKWSCDLRTVLVYLNYTENDPSSAYMPDVVEIDRCSGYCEKGFQDDFIDNSDTDEQTGSWSGGGGSGDSKKILIDIKETNNNNNNNNNGRNDRTKSGGGGSGDSKKILIDIKETNNNDNNERNDRTKSGSRYIDIDEENGDDGGIIEDPEHKGSKTYIDLKERNRNKREIPSRTYVDNYEGDGGPIKIDLQEFERREMLQQDRPTWKAEFCQPSLTKDMDFLIAKTDLSASVGSITPMRKKVTKHLACECRA